MSATRRVAASAALVAASVVGAASAASAHAVLLRTDPSPQTTVASSPTTIRLEFSEPVEAAFGAVRVFDVDGHRIDAGKIERVRGNREVDLPVPGLSNGTYTVTWRVASTDGHVVSGGFEFYVGAPSTISAVAVTRDQGAGRIVGWGYGVARFAWFGALVAMVGMVTLRRWVWTPAVRAAGLAASPAAEDFRRRFRRALPLAWVVLVSSGALIIVFQGATVSGLSLADSARPTVVAEVLRTSFGRSWLVGAAFTLAALAPVMALIRRHPLFGLRPSVWIAVLGVFSFGACLAVALSGHARTDPRPALAVPSVAIHLVAVGVWVGGLAALVMLAGPSWRSLPRDDRAGVLREVVPRFSRVAVVAVGIVVVTGVVNAVANFGALSDLWRLDYGRVVGAKVVLLAVAIALAARHRWVVPARLADQASGAATVTSFQRSSAAELGVLVVTVAMAAALVALVPGRSLALAAKGPVNQQRQAGSYTVQLFIDPTTVGTNQVHVTFVNAQGLGAAEVTNATVTLGPVGAALQPVAMRLISPGHFVGDATLPAPGPYRLSASAGPGASTTFDFRLRGAEPGRR